MDDIRHAGLIARRIRGRWLGALIEGPSGAGKSDLALRALDRGFRLVADDRVLVWAADGRVFGRAPAPLRGLIEARGLGVIPVEPVAFAEIGQCSPRDARAHARACNRLICSIDIPP